jgi:transcriptional regulator with XRE-family HTH domain
MIDRTNIANKLIALRAARNIPLDAIARSIGVSISTVQRWESGKHFPHRVQLYKLAYVYPELASIIRHREHSPNSRREVSQ